MNIFRAFLLFVLSPLLILVLFILGIIITINLTILSPAFIVDELDKLDTYSVITEQVKAQLPDDELIAPIIDDITTDLKPWIKEQTKIVIYDGYSYLKGDEELNITISLESFRTSIEKSLKQHLHDFLPPALEGVQESLREVYLLPIYDEIGKIIPEHFVINETSLDPEIMMILEQARRIVDYIKLTYIISIGLAVILLLLIALTHRWRAKPIALSVGISFSIVGIASIGTTLTSRFTNTVINQFAGEADFLFKLQGMIYQFIIDCTAPLLIFGIGFLIAGIVLIILSVLLKSPEADALL